MEEENKRRKTRRRQFCVRLTKVDCGERRACEPRAPLLGRCWLDPQTPEGSNAPLAAVSLRLGIFGFVNTGRMVGSLIAAARPVSAQQYRCYLVGRYAGAGHGR